MRRVEVEGTRTVWVGLEGWVDAVFTVRRSQRASAEFYKRMRSVVRSVAVEDIRACRDEETLVLVEQMLKGRHSMLHGPERCFSREEGAALRVEVHNQLRRVRTGAIDRPKRKKGPAFDIGSIPTERLRALVQRYKDMDVVETMREELRRRETREEAA